MGRSSRTLLAPHRPAPSSPLSLSLHRPPAALARHLRAMLGQEVLVMPTFQRTAVPLLEVSPATEEDKDRCLHTFYRAAHHICSTLHAAGLFADYADPVSGLLHYGSSSQVYSEAEGAEVLLGYHIDSSVGCRLIVHPEWGYAAYPATIFIDSAAPLDLVQEAIKGLPGPA